VPLPEPGAPKMMALTISSHPEYGLLYFRKRTAS